MLLLGRLVEEEVIIQTPQGDVIRIKVTGFNKQGGEQQVKLGFEAPSHIRIDRSEIYEDRKKTTNNRTGRRSY